MKKLKLLLPLLLVLLLPTTSLATRQYMTGFEWGDFDSGKCVTGTNDGGGCTSNTDCTGGGTCGYNMEFGYEYSAGSDMHVQDSVVRTTYCDYNAEANRGKACSSNSDCDTALSCATNADCPGAICNGSSVCQDECLTDPTNTSSLYLGPKSTKANYYKTTLPDNNDYYTTLIMNVTTLPTRSDATGILAYEMGGAVGCVLEAERLTDTTYRVSAYYNSQGGRCSGGTNVNTKCTLDEECTAETAGEGKCVQSPYASSKIMLLNQWYPVGLLQETDPPTGQVTCGLVESGFTERLATRNEGECTEDLWACSTNSDCTGGEFGRCSDWDYTIDINGDDYCTTNADCSATCNGSTCNISAVQLIDTLVVGSETAPSRNWGIYVDHIRVDDASLDDIKVGRIADIVPTSDVEANLSQTGCSGSGNRYNCIDDYGSASNNDGNTTYLSRNGNPNNDRFGLGNFTIASHESIATGAGVSITGMFNDTNDGSPGTGKYVALCPDGGGGSENFGCNTCSVDSDCLNGMECISNECWLDLSNYSVDGGYHWPSLLYVGTDPPGAATTWCLGGACTGSGFNLDNLNLGLKTASSGAFRTSAQIVEVDIKGTNPSLPGKAVDGNGDGVIRAVIAGDSTANDIVFHAEINSRLDDYDAIQTCTRGSTTILDVYENIDTILNGRVCATNSDCSFGGPCTNNVCGANFMQCQAIRGSLGRADDMFLMTGVNTVSSGAGIPADTCEGGTNDGYSCSTNGDCAGGGVCTERPAGVCRGGVNNGKDCFCTPNGGVTVNPASPNEAHYCLNSTYWLSTSTDYEVCQACSSNTDCLTNIPCTTSGDCQGKPCLSGECSATCNTDTGICGRTIDSTKLSNVVPPGWRLPGCVGDSACPDGVCLQSNTTAEYAKGLQDLVTYVDGLTGGDAVNLILVPQAPAVTNRTCTVDTDCPVGTECLDTGKCFKAFFDVFSQFGNRHGIINKMQHAVAESYGLNYIEIPRHFKEKCIGPDGSIDRFWCMRDAVHQNFDLGIPLIGEVFEKCIERINGNEDGVCFGNVCTQGWTKRGYCATNSDCNTYKCY